MNETVKKVTKSKKLQALAVSSIKDIDDLSALCMPCHFEFTVLKLEQYICNELLHRMFFS